MKNKLLITTALVALFSASNVSAAVLTMTEGDVIENPNPEAKDDRGAVNYDAITIDGGSLILNDYDIRSNGDIYISGGNIKINDGHGLSGLDGILNITGGVITLDHTAMEGRKTNVSGDALINVNNKAMFGGRRELYIENGILNLSNGIVMAEDLVKMTGGEINMEQSYLWGLTGGYECNGSECTTYNFSGGTINANKDRNIILADSVSVDNTINIAKGATLETYNDYIYIGTDHTFYIYSGNIDDVIFSGKTVLKLTDAGVINLSGKLVSDVSGNDLGKIYFKDSNAQIDGNVENVSLIFDDSNSLNGAISGNIGDLTTLAINNGTLSYDKEATGTITTVKVGNGTTLDIGNKTLYSTGDKVDGEGIIFDDNSTLALTITDKDSYGKLKANYIQISENGTNLNMTLNGAALAKGETATFKLFNGADTADVEINGRFANLSKNSRYEFIDNGDGTFNVTAKDSVADVISDAGATDNNIKTAEAWDSVIGSGNNEITIAITEKFAQLSNGSTSEDRQNYIDALTAVAPEVAPMVQQTQAEISNQIFGAFGTRLSGGSISTGGKGIASGDSMFERGAMWIQGLVNKSKLDDTSKAKGFDADSAGVAFGFEKFVTDNTKAGIGYAYTKTDIDGFMRDTDVDTHTAIVYSEYKPNNWYVNGIATYGWSDYSEKKNVAGVNVKADYDVETLGLQAMTGYDMNVNGFGVTPEAGLRYVHIKQDSYKDSADQRVSSDDSDILTGVIGAKVNKGFELSDNVTIKPEVRVAATYDLMNDDVNSVVTLVNGSAYAVEGGALDRFGMEFGAGVTAEVNDNVVLSLGYEGKFRQDYQDHTGLLNVKYKF